MLATYHMRDTVHLSPAHVAITFGAMNVSALLGSLSVSERKRFLPGPVLAITTVGLTAGLLLASVSVVWVMVAALVVYKFFDGATDSTTSMLTVRYVPGHIFGRASGLLRLAHGVPSTFGPILLLPLVSGLGTSGAFIALGLCGLVPVLLLVRFRRLWRAGGTTDPSPKPSSTTTEESVV